MLEFRKDADGTVYLTGTFDAAQAERAREFFESITSSCTVDCRDLTYISSAGLGVLIFTHQRLTDQGCGLKLTNLSRHIGELFRYTGLDKVFDIS
jgi:anti-anti-sigma factor